MLPVDNNALNEIQWNHRETGVADFVQLSSKPLIPGRRRCILFAQSSRKSFQFCSLGK
jgi:hypothetical protein